MGTLQYSEGKWNGDSISPQIHNNKKNSYNHNNKNIIRLRETDSRYLNNCKRIQQKKKHKTRRKNKK